MQNSQSVFEVALSFITSDNTRNPSTLKLKNHKLKSIETSELEKCANFNLTEIKIVNLSNNLIDEVPLSFVHSFSQITRLYLDNNYLYKLPKEISRLQDLVTLALNNNILTFLPSSIANLSKLSSLLVNNNKLVVLPIEFGRLKELKRLYLHNNRLQNLPCIFHELKSLTELSIQWFAYLDPPIRRLVKHEGNGIEILDKLKFFSQQNAQNHQAFFEFNQFYAFFCKEAFNADRKTSQGNYILNQACAYGDIVFAEELLRSKAVQNLNTLDQFNLTPLAITIRDDQVKLAKLLVQHGATINMDLTVCGNHLNIATMRMNQNLVKYLIKHGADPNIADSEGNSPMHLIVSIFDKNVNDAARICELLMRNKANPNLKNNDLWTPMHLAARRGQIEAIKWMLNYNQKAKSTGKTVKEIFDVNKRGGELGWTPLHLAINSNHTAVVMLLLKTDVKLFKKNKENLSPKQVFTGNLVLYKYIMREEIDWITRYVYEKIYKSTTMLSDTKTILLGDFNDAKMSSHMNNWNSQSTAANKMSQIEARQSYLVGKTSEINQTKEDLSNTLSYHSADIISQTDIDSPLNSSRSQKINVFNYISDEKNVPKVTVDITMVKSVILPSKSNKKALPYNVESPLKIQEMVNGNFKGPKMNKIEKNVIWRKEFKQKLVDYCKVHNEGSNIIGKIEQRALLVQRKRVLNRQMFLVERLNAFVCLKNSKNMEMVLLLMCSMLEELSKDELCKDMTANLLKLEIVRNLVVPKDSKLFGSVINLLKFMAKQQKQSKLIVYELENSLTGMGVSN